MSSWLSIFKPDAADEDGDDQNLHSSSGAGVIKDALSHHLRGVAAFLAPPPLSSPLQKNTTTTTTTTTTSSEAINGIKNDLAEIEESFKSGLSLLSTKLTSSFMKFASNNDDDNGDDDDQEEEGGYDDDDDEDVAGINEEVVEFVRELSLRSEFWTDFPINLPIEFDMSDYQREHVAAIERLVPSLVTLREKICSHLSDGQFWMIYFTILLPRLDECDLENLSMPKIVEIRGTLLQKLQNERNASNHSEVVVSTEKDANKDDDSLPQQNISDETLGEPQEAETVDNQKLGPWLEEDGPNGPNPGTSLDGQRQGQNEDDISFSDLENDEKDSPFDFRAGQRHTVGSLGASSGWTHLIENSQAPGSRQKAAEEKDSEGEESNDWQHVDDVDLESLVSV